MTDGKADEFPVGPVVTTRQARIAWKRERMIAQEEVAVLRQKLRECTQREHINKIQRCREEAIEYLEALNKYKKGLKSCMQSLQFIVQTCFLQEELLTIASCHDTLHIYTVHLLKYIQISFMYHYNVITSVTNVLCLIVGLYKMCEVVEISDDDECLQFYASQASNSVEECSQSSHNALVSTSSDLNSAPEEICPVDRKKVV